MWLSSFGSIIYFHLYYPTLVISKISFYVINSTVILLIQYYFFICMWNNKFVIYVWLMESKGITTPSVSSSGQYWSMVTLENRSQTHSQVSP